MASVLCFVAALATAVSPLLASAPPGVTGQIDTYAVPLWLTAMALALPRVSGWLQEGLVVLTPLTAIAVIVALDISTRDASAAGQVFLCFPVLFAASELRRAGAALVTITAVGGDAAVVFSVRDPTQALTDFLFVTITLIMIAVLLVAAGTRHEELVGRLRRQADVDPLTGLVTRRALDEAMHAALAGPATDRSNLGAALILVDLDQFKAINDTHGHPVGDDVLIHVGQILTQRLTTGAVASRIGGDEMAVLIPACSVEEAGMTADGVAAAIRCSPLDLSDGVRIPITASVGMAHSPPGLMSMQELYSAADAALYRTKRARRALMGTEHS
jgi:diguanylate cyclase (GGDEF)-like protein